MNRPATTGLRIFPSRKLITRAPGAAGPLPAVLGAMIVLVAFAVFLRGFDSARTTFDSSAADFVAGWNALAESNGRTLLLFELPVLESGEGGDLVFEHAWTDTLRLSGRVDEPSGMLVEATVVGSPETDGGPLIAEAMDLLIAVLEPDLDASARAVVLQELGLVGGGGPADGSATVGTTDLQVGFQRSSGLVGLGAAPHGTVSSGLDGR